MDVRTVVRLNTVRLRLKLRNLFLENYTTFYCFFFHCRLLSKWLRYCTDSLEIAVFPNPTSWSVIPGPLTPTPMAHWSSHFWQLMKTIWQPWPLLCQVKGMPDFCSPVMLPYVRTCLPCMGPETAASVKPTESSRGSEPWPGLPARWKRFPGILWISSYFISSLTMYWEMKTGR